MTRERCSEVWAVDKVRMVDMDQTNPKHRKWTPEITGTIEKDKKETLHLRVRRVATPVTVENI